MTRAAVTLYGRPGCHLCELMTEEIEPLCRAADRALIVIDVDSDPALRERYALRIPVACLGAEELASWPLQPEIVAARLQMHDGEPGDP